MEFVVTQLEESTKNIGRFLPNGAPLSRGERWNGLISVILIIGDQGTYNRQGSLGFGIKLLMCETKVSGTMW